MNRQVLLPISGLIALFAVSADAAGPDFNKDVLPIFRKYCNGCHNSKEAEGGLVLEDFARALKGGETGAAIVKGNSVDSRLWKLVTATDDSRMPPKDQQAPRPEELAVIKSWIDGGALAPEGGPLAQGLDTPRIPLKGVPRNPVTSIAVAPAGNWIALAHPHSVDLLEPRNLDGIVRTLTGHSGQISDVSFSNDSQRLCVAGGEPGLSGEVTLWKTGDWTRQGLFQGHRDAIYSARQSPDGKLLATASYDRDIQIWDVATLQPIRSLTGHNDAVFGVAFAPSGQLLSTASGDRTVKIWDVASGQRLDTFSQPAKDQYTVAFSPDGRTIAAGGVDCRLRIWQLSDSAREGTNPILFSRFAHEGPILKVVFSHHGKLLATSSEDRFIKIWETRAFTQVAVLPRQADWSAAISFAHDDSRLYVGLMDGKIATYPIDPQWIDGLTPPKPLSNMLEATTSDRPPVDTAAVSEVEPNDSPVDATPLKVPGKIGGKLQGPAGQTDIDLYRIESRVGQIWTIEVNAARSGSLADTRVEVLDLQGQPVLRGRLQAVRDSWINFRPIDSSSADVRVEFWEEMDLNQFLYLNGEICKTFRAPQGPDSGFQLYSINGKRRNYFDTSATAHAKDEPCYIVEAYPADAKIIDNGLPVFPLPFANDDDADRKLGTDSRLTFIAPADGQYLIKVTDVRGFSGDKFQYTLEVRTPQPDFGVSLSTLNPKVPAGSGQRLRFTANRIDGFDGDIRLDILGLPEGFSASSPIIIPAGHVETTSVLSAAAEAMPPRKEDWERTTVLATARIGNTLITKTIGTLGEIKLEKPPVFRVRLLTDDPAHTSADGALVILPGTTITAKIIVERNGFEEDIKFDVDNLPHGVIVDNIGLSGVLVRARETQRQIFLTARPWVPATTRLIHAVSQIQGNQASRPIELRVGRTESLAHE